MRIIPLTISFSFLFTSIFAQTCVHDDLSRTMRISWTRRKCVDSIIGYKCPIEVKFVDKASNKTIQVISFLSTALYPESFSKYSHVRSYSTGKNKNATLLDDDFGDIVVADFNFDSREDIAIKSDVENSGTYYRFYIQGKDKLFHLDSFLTDSMRIFPTFFNRKKKILTTYQVADVGHEGEQLYRLDIWKNKWSMIQHRFITVH